MKIVIQCAGNKSVGGYWKNTIGEDVLFVSRPDLVPHFKGRYAHPDSIDGEKTNKTWCMQIMEYNTSAHNNPCRLYKAFELYQNTAYADLVSKFGIDNIYVLSAGWGLLRSDFLTPNYDITFQAQAKTYQRRKKHDSFHDLCQMTVREDEHIVYLGGKDYLPMFVRLTKNIKCKKTIIYNSKNTPNYYGYEVLRYETKIRTNWHYTCAQEIIAGTFSVI